MKRVMKLMPKEGSELLDLGYRSYEIQESLNLNGENTWVPLWQFVCLSDDEAKETWSRYQSTGCIDQVMWEE